jgi:hypothetical protein
MKQPESQGVPTIQGWLLAALGDGAFWVGVLLLYLLATTPVKGADLGAICWDATCDLAAPPYGGSATLVRVDENGVGVLVTCSHTFHGAGTGNVSVEFRNGFKTKARLLGMDDENDLAVFAIRAPEGVTLPPAVKLASRNEGEVIAVGFPWYGQGKMHYTTGKVVRIDGNGRVLFAANPRVHSGYSGGALFNERGEYLGAISGFDGDGLSIAGSGEPLRRLLSRYVEVQP